MMYRTIKVVVTTLFFNLAALATNAQTQCPSFKSADALLNQVYQQILTEYGTDEQFISKFKASQRAWLKFRDAQLEALFPEDDKRYYGSSYPMCACESLAVLTQARNAQLQVWITGVEEGEVCAGSVKVADR